MMIIDAHAHFTADDRAMVGMPDQWDVKILNVCVAHNDWRAKQADVYRRLASQRPDRYAWCTSFDLPEGADDRAWAERVIAQLDSDFAAGAIGCKLWKNVGMELKRDGGYVMPDDALFDPVYAHLQRRGWTLLVHAAEPLACWQPLDERSPHYGYYKQNPKWHMHGRTDMPSHAQIIAARDRVIERYPRLRIVGAHLGSMEYDLGVMAEHLDRFANFAMDTSARLGDMASHPRDKLIAFMERYQDRMLFGTDMGLWSGNDPVKRASDLKFITQQYATERAFYCTDQVMRIGGRDVPGLALAEGVRQKLFVTNAQRWYPGV